MAIRDWHPGQLGVLWVGGVGLDWMVCSLNDSPQENVLMTLIVGVPLLIITWKWFGGRNRPKDSQSNSGPGHG